jgi:hypothetical protein
MATETSSIDDILTASMNEKTPVAPEQQAEEVSEDVEDIKQEAEESPTAEASETNEYGDEEKTPEKAVDEYGNETAAPRVYSEEEVNERINAAIRDRLSRMERNQQPQQHQQMQQQTQQGFQYDENSQESWQQQLESFVEQTYYKINEKQAQQSQRAREQQAYEEHGQKFREGAAKFADFEKVVASQPITDAMTLATRAMKDPAAFLYAASKRAPQELERISKIPDQYVQIAEMAKLEVSMKQQKPMTKTPRPVSRTQEDATIAHKSDKQPSIEDLIARDAAKRLALQKKRRG